MQPFARRFLEVFCHLLILVSCTMVGAWVHRDRFILPKAAEWEAQCAIEIANLDMGEKCAAYNGCCEKHGNAECKGADRMLEYYPCVDGLVKDEDLYCHCVQKVILADHKPQCSEEAQQKSCYSFVKCCKKADEEKCAAYDGGELEHPKKCKPEKPFDFASATCRCAVHTKDPGTRIPPGDPPATSRKLESRMTPPKETGETANTTAAGGPGGNNAGGIRGSDTFFGGPKKIGYLMLAFVFAATWAN